MITKTPEQCHVFVLGLLLLTLNKLPPYSKVFTANFEHVFVSWDFLSCGESVTRVCGRIIYRVVGLAPQFLSNKIRICFSQGCVCFIPFQRAKQTHVIFHLLLNRQAVILLCLSVQVGSKVLLFQKKVFFAKDSCLSHNQKFSKFAYVFTPSDYI